MRAIFTFHSIDDERSLLSFSPKSLSALLNALKNKKIPVCDINTLMKPETKRGVALTFDDGMHSVIKNALPVLKDYGVNAHIFISTDSVNSKKWPTPTTGIPGFKMLGWGEIEKLHKYGIHIESHTKTHPDMRTLSSSCVEDECIGSDEIILERLGRLPEYFAYPFGYHNNSTRNFIRQRYRGGVTTELRMIGNNEDLATIPRLDSYYFRSDATINRLDSPAMNAYLYLRWKLRTWKGSHCLPESD